MIQSLEMPEIEKSSDPVPYYRNMVLESLISPCLVALINKDPDLVTNTPREQLTALILNKLLREWNVYYDDIRKQPISPNLKALLSSTKKREQEKLLKGQVFRENELLNLLFSACLDYGFTFSYYKGYKLPKDINPHDLPDLCALDDSNKVIQSGNTTLTDKQLKKFIENHNAVVARFLDKGDSWHCFLNTYHGMNGKENAHQQAHCHYISDKFGISRDKVVESIKAGFYPATPIHIEVLDHGFQVGTP